MCSGAWTHSSSSSCRICSFNFSLLDQVHAQFLGEGYHLLSPVIQSLWDWKWNPYLSLTSFCSWIHLFSWVSSSFSFLSISSFFFFFSNCWSDWPMATSVPTLDAEARAYKDQSISPHNCVRSKPHNKSLVLITQDGLLLWLNLDTSSEFFKTR